MTTTKPPNTADAVSADVVSKVYLIDDDIDVRKLLTMSLSLHNLECVAFDNAEAFLDIADSSVAGCILLDLQMPGMNGLELQQALNDREIHTPVIFITAHGDVARSVEALKAGAMDFNVVLRVVSQRRQR